MLFDSRTRAKLLEAGLDADALRDIEEAVAAEAEATAEEVTAFLGGGPGSDPTAAYSDMDQTHSTAAHPEHTIEYVDLFTHSQDVRGYVRFDTWGAYVEGARALDDEVVELELGPTVHDRVRFARSREALE
jgi:regulator of RNase E activity RraB